MLEKVYGLFFKAVSETLLELCSDSKYLGTKPGITAVLHTWGQNLMFHPHIHCIVTGGGLTDEGSWRNSRKKFFIPVKVLSRKFRGKFLSFLKRAVLSFDPTLYRDEWVVYCKPPFKNVSKVIEYLSRYTHRVAISNNRILALKDGKVTFAWRDYRDGNKKKNMTVTADEFIRRFMLHILPSGFRKIRHFGILAARNKSTRIALCQTLTNIVVSSKTKAATALDTLRKMLGKNFNRCPCCGIGHLSKALSVDRGTLVVSFFSFLLSSNGLGGSLTLNKSSKDFRSDRIFATLHHLLCKSLIAQGDFTGMIPYSEFGIMNRDPAGV